MANILVGPQRRVYPAPMVLLGANVNGKPDFMLLGNVTIVNHEPLMIAVAPQNARHTTLGIKQNQSFSVSVPSVDQLKEADFCGIASGRDVDKVNICKFKVFYGKVSGAPLIDQCPLNLACKVVHTLNLGSHSLFVGTIDESYAEESCLTDGKPDLSKAKPFCLSFHPDGEYITLGKVIAKSSSVGKELKPKK